MARPVEDCFVRMAHGDQCRGRSKSPQGRARPHCSQWLHKCMQFPLFRHRAYSCLWSRLCSPTHSHNYNLLPHNHTNLQQERLRKEGSRLHNAQHNQVQSHKCIRLSHSRTGLELCSDYNRGYRENNMLDRGNLLHCTYRCCRFCYMEVGSMRNKSFGNYSCRGHSRMGRYLSHTKARRSLGNSLRSRSCNLRMYMRMERHYKEGSRSMNNTSDKRSFALCILRSDKSLL